MNPSSEFKKRSILILYISLFVVVEVVFGYFMFEARRVFMENSIQNGKYMAQTQVEKIEKQMEKFYLAVNQVGKDLDKMVDLQLSHTNIQQYMNYYCEKISGEFVTTSFDIYAVLDDRIVAAHPWAGDDDYDFASTSWYSDAVAAGPGNIVCSNLYRDAVTGQNVFTMSLALSDRQDVVAMDVYLMGENWMDLSHLPNGYSIQVYDHQRALTYSTGQEDSKIPHDDILDNAFIEVSYYGECSNGKGNLYMCKLSNGWGAVIIIPSDYLISKENLLLINLGLFLNTLNMAITSVFLVLHLRNIKTLRQDFLTGLLNKDSLVKDIRKRLKSTGGILLIVDLDNFKKVNDNYGHDHGDLILIQMAEILHTCFRKTDCIGRFGGDEFIIYVDAPLTDDILNRKIVEVIHQVKLLAEQYPLSDLTVSFGGCRCKKGDKYVDVFKCADEALYEVKKSGKCGFSMRDYAPASYEQEQSFDHRANSEPSER